MDDPLDPDGVTVVFTWGPVWGWTVFAIELVLRILAIIIIPRNRRPQTAAAWLLAILFIPELGWLLFLIFGSRRVNKLRRKRQEEVNSFLASEIEDAHYASDPATWPDWLPQVVHLNHQLGAMPLVGGNRFEFLPDYETAIAEMTKAVRGAKSIIHAEFYILSLDDTTKEFFDALAEARARGVVVRVLWDHVANLRQPGYRATRRFLRQHGIEAHLMLPLSLWPWAFLRPDLRNHRKLLVIDGKVAFTGSQNMIDSSYNKRGNIKRGLHWKDLMVRFEGPIAGAIDALFHSDWYAETGDFLEDEVVVTEPLDGRVASAQVVPSGPGFTGENNLKLFNAAVYAAKEKLIITSPYFVPDDSMLYAITTAAQSGVHVELFVSEIGDQAMVFHAQRSYYELLLEAGVHIWLYAAPTILHAKHLTVDDEVAIVGSSNMDMRSFSLNYEISVLVHSKEFVDEMRAIEQHYRDSSRELTLEEWRRQPLRSQALDNIMRLTAGLQ